MIWTRLLLLMTYWTQTSYAHSSPNRYVSIQPFLQVIFMQYQKSLYIFKANWTVLILLQKPVMDSWIPAILQNIRNIIQQNQMAIHPGVKRNWNRGLRWLSTQISSPNTSRNKCAPLGFIGSLAHLLFGTVTDDEIQMKYQQALQTAMTFCKSYHSSCQFFNFCHQMK